MSKRIGLITSRMLQPDEVNKIKDTYDLHSVLPCTFDSLYTHYKQLYSYWIKENEDDDATGIGAAFLYDAQRFELRQNTNPHKKELCHRIMNYIQMSIEKWENIIRYLLNNGSDYVGVFITSDEEYDSASRSLTRAINNQVSYLTKEDLTSTRIMFMQYGIIYFFEDQFS
jgi:hypothetical protein